MSPRVLHFSAFIFWGKCTYLPLVVTDVLCKAPMHLVFVTLSKEGVHSTLERIVFYVLLPFQSSISHYIYSMSVSRSCLIIDQCVDMPITITQRTKINNVMNCINECNECTKVQNPRRHEFMPQTIGLHSGRELED